MFIQGADRGGRVVGVVALGASVLAACWLFAFSEGSVGELPWWSVGVAVLVVIFVVGFAWLLSKIAHGGDWSNRRNGRQSPPIKEAVTRPSELVG